MGSSQATRIYRPSQSPREPRQAPSASAAASEAGLTTEVDFIFTTHRVWLGTGGYAERDDDPDALY